MKIINSLTGHKTKIFLLSFLLVTISIAKCSEENDIKNKFNIVYQEWVNYCDTHPRNPLSSSNSSYTENMPFEQILKLGVSALPCIYEQMKTDIDDPYIFGLYLAFYKISKITHYSGISRPEGKPTYLVYQKWYRKEYPDTLNKFQKLYTIWISEPSESKFHYPYTQFYLKKGEKFFNTPRNTSQKIKDLYQLTTFEKIRRIGIPALPYAFEKLKEGDLDVLPLINYWTDNALEKAIEQNAIPQEKIQAFSLGWWEENKAQWAMPDILAMEK